MSLGINALKGLGIIAISVAATAAPAELIRLVKPSQAASLEYDGVAMTVYYLARSGPLEIIATFADLGSPTPPSQLRMSLADGDDIGFTIPGRSDVSFQFTRTDSLIEVRKNQAELGSLATN